MPDDIKRQKDIDKIARIDSSLLLQTWLIVDEMLLEQLQPIRNGLKRRRTRSGKGARPSSYFFMFLCSAGVLYQNGTMTMGELSRATSIPQSTVTRMIDWMVENGYVDRFNDDADRRVVRIRLTDNGRELLLAAKSLFQEIAATSILRIPAIQRTAVLFLLKDLSSAWQRVYEEQFADAHLPE